MNDLMKKFTSYMEHHEYTLLVIFTLLTLILYPLFETSSNGSLLYHGLITLLLLAGVASANRKNRFIKLGLFLGGLAFVLNRVDFISGTESNISLLYMIVTLAFFVLITINVIVSLLDHGKINPHVIFGSIAGYLMIGMAGSYLFAIIETLQPGSFAPFVTMIGNIPSMLYYTFVSMLTLGYGDMVPVGGHAQIRSILVAVAGQLYLVILMGVLIGKYVRDK